ncbi:kinetochore Sim4 complex subunit Fta2, partial [Diaporthe sp. PMI_573]
YFWEAYLGPDRDPREVTYYIDPFYCECREYGRIRDALVNGTLKDNPALPCYGYMILRPEDDEFLHQNGVQLSGEHSGADSHNSSETPCATRAIVKKLAGPASGLTVRRQGKVLRDILILNRLGIYNRDVRADNYRDGLLVDFGSSVTELDIILRKFDEDELRETILEVGGVFEDML